MSEVMTIRVDRKTKGRLEKLARAMDRSKSYLAAEAIRAYVDLNEWQIAEIKAALNEADAGDFASDTEVGRVMKKWRRGAVKWLRRALKNLDDEAAYIARDDVEAATRMVERIASAVEQLANHPALGRPGRVPRTVSS